MNEPNPIPCTNVYCPVWFYPSPEWQPFGTFCPLCRGVIHDAVQDFYNADNESPSNC